MSRLGGDIILAAVHFALGKPKHGQKAMLACNISPTKILCSPEYQQSRLPFRGIHIIALIFFFLLCAVSGIRTSDHDT